MKFLMVAPKFVSKIGLYYDFPIGVAYISAVLKQAGFDVETINLCHSKLQVDQALEKVINEKCIDVVGIGGLSPHFHMVNDILKECKKVNPDIITIVGGGLVSCEPEMVLEMLDADIGVLNEGEITIQALAGKLVDGKSLDSVKGIVYKDKNGTIRRNPPRERIQDLDTLPWPDYEGFELGRYLDLQWPNDMDALNFYEDPRVAPLIASRGCPYPCTFCFHPIGDKYKQHSLDNIFEHIEYLIKEYQINGLFMLDELFATKNNHKRLKEFCHRIKEYPLQWFAQLRVDSVNREILRLCKDSGCNLISYGIESASNKVLKSMKKHITVKQINKALEETYQAGIGNKGNLIFGDKAETVDTINESLKWWSENIKYQIQPSALSAYPGTPLYHYAVKKGLIKDKKAFLKYNQWVNVTNMTQEEFNAMVNVITVSRRHICRIPAKVLSCKELYGDEIKGKAYSFEVQCPHCGQNVKYEKMNSSGTGLSIYNIIYCKACHQKFNTLPFNIEKTIADFLDMVGDDEFAIWDNVNMLTAMNVRLMERVNYVIPRNAKPEEVRNSVKHVLYTVNKKFERKQFSQVLGLRVRGINVVPLYLYTHVEDAMEVMIQLASIGIQKQETDVVALRQELGLAAMRECKAEYPYAMFAEGYTADVWDSKEHKDKTAIWFIPVQVGEKVTAMFGFEMPNSKWNIGFQIPKDFMLREF